MSVLLTEGDRALDDIFCVNMDNDQVFTQDWLQECIKTAEQQLSTVKQALRKPIMNGAPLAVALEALRGLPLAAHWNGREPGVFGRIGLPFHVWALLGGGVPFCTNRFAIPVGMTARFKVQVQHFKT